MRLLLCGGAGFIGGNFLEYMLQKRNNIEIICADAMTYAGNPKTLEMAGKWGDYTFIKGNICRREFVEKIFQDYKPNVVVNFAAESHVDNSILNPALFLKTNVEGCGVLLDMALRYGVDRFHQVSTDEVYGDLPLDRPDLLFTEASPLKPSSPYSASKAAADLLCLSYFRTYGLPVTISRSSNNYGPYQHREKLIPLSIVRLIDGSGIPVFGTGKNVRDWIYVKDHCRAIEAILEKGTPGEIYNVGANCEKSNLEVIGSILKLLHGDWDAVLFTRDRPGHDLRYALDSSRLKKKTGWKAETSFEEGLRKTVEWYRENSEWTKLCGEAF